MFWWYIILLFTITHSAGNPLAHYGAEGEVLQPRQLRRKDDVAQTLFFFVSPCHRCSLGVLKIRLMLFSFRSAALGSVQLTSPLFVLEEYESTRLLL